MGGEGNKFEANLAQAAHNKASDAHNLADRAIREMANHEKTCAERYTDIKEVMKEMKTLINSIRTDFNTTQSAMQTSINNLSNASHESIGMWKGISIVSLGIGILYGFLKLTGIVA